MTIQRFFITAFFVCLCFLANAQMVSVYKTGGEPVSYDLNEIDSVRFMPEKIRENLDEFPYTGSYGSPNSKIWGNTGMIPVTPGNLVTYTSAGLNDYCCVFFDKNKNGISFGRKTLDSIEGNGKSIIISEALKAPDGTAFVCIYGTKRNAKSYVPYDLSIEIDRSGPSNPTHQLISEFPYIGSYNSPTSKAWGNTGKIPIEPGTFITYTSGGLNDYCCVFFDKDEKAIAFGTKCPGLNGEDNFQYQSTIISETLIAPVGAASVCIYGNNSSQRTYVPYKLSVDIFKDETLANSMSSNLSELSEYIRQQQKGKEYADKLAVNQDLAKLIQRYPSGSGIRNSCHKMPAAISVTDDDSIDAFLDSSWSGAGRNTGFYSALFPVLASIDAPATEACVGYFIGLDIDSPNASAMAAKELASSAGWELANHTLHHRYRYAYKVKHYSEITSLPITPVVSRFTPQASQEGTYIYVEDDNKCYYLNTSKQWSEVPKGFEPVYLMDLEGNHIADCPLYDNIREIWDNQILIEKHLQYKPITYIQPGHRASKKRVDYAKASHKYILSGANATSKNVICTPLSMSIQRISVNVGNESNEVGDEFFEELKSLFKEVIDNGNSAIMMLHMYNSGWSNEIEKNLVSHGGIYPDAWVHPTNIPGSVADWLKPSKETGLSSWKDWYPCPGTRLYQLWRFLKWAKEEKGILLLTVRDNLDRMANKSEAGYFVKSKQAAFDDNDYDYFIEDCFGNITLHKKTN